MASAKQFVRLPLGPDSVAQSDTHPTGHWEVAGLISIGSGNIL